MAILNPALLRRRIQFVAQSALVHNIASLYGTQIAAYIFPLVTLPYLARVLGSSAWGRVAFAQAFAAYITLFIEFGFNISATREVSQQRDSRDNLSHILAGVLGAKGALTVVSLGVIGICGRVMPIFRTDIRLLYGGTLFGIAQGFNMAWFFQGLERMKLPAALDVLARAAGTLGIFLWVRRPDQAWRVLSIQATASIGAALILLVLCYREVSFRLPSRADIRGAISNGASMFLFRGAVSLYTIGNSLILGLLASPASVGYYSGAERIERAVLGLTTPISQSLFPRLSHLLGTSHERAARLVRLSLLFMIVSSLAAAVTLWIVAPWIVRIILGPGFTPATPVFRILTILVPAIAISGVLGLNWMLPLRLDRPFNGIIIAGGIMNLILALVLARPMAQEGMAWAVVASEAVITVAMFAYLHHRRLNPLCDRERLAKSLDELIRVAPE